MHPLIQVLRSELIAIIKSIDNGNCDISDIKDMNEVITVLHKTIRKKVIVELTDIVDVLTYGYI